MCITTNTHLQQAAAAVAAATTITMHICTICRDRVIYDKFVETLTLSASICHALKIACVYPLLQCIDFVSHSQPLAQKAMNFTRALQVEMENCDECIDAM